MTKMTHKAVMEDLRTRGFHIGLAAISKNIKNGVFPFGSVINVGPSGRVTTLILRKNYEKWADENIGPVLTRMKGENNARNPDL